ncbi:hypothetical protein CVT26_000287 [Gymnopilus dilepis]|uniref:Uncharacterized protein n=1 Tax=Gymnopilus dilepis TaxID=231916 RepID=A0A409XDJ1_9AGAR|nr:hypothetical protein CVT26_000287 [Gymnopilus dilepis]
MKLHQHSHADFCVHPLEPPDLSSAVEWTRRYVDELVVLALAAYGVQADDDEPDMDALVRRIRSECSTSYIGITLCTISEAPHFLVDPYTALTPNTTESHSIWFDIPKTMADGQVTLCFAFRIYSYSRFKDPITYCTSYIVQLAEYVARLRSTSRRGVAPTIRSFFRQLVEE